MENALKNNDITRTIVLANCFVNMYTIKSTYSKELMHEIEKNCPNIFKCELRVQEFYMDLIKNKINKIFKST